MSSQPATPTATVHENYGGSPPENYERYFVPVIGKPSARRLLQAARLRTGQRVLDVACGTGVAARLAAEAVGPGGRVTGIDGNPGMLGVARTVSAPGPAIEWHQAPAEDLPFSDGSFDTVVCSLSLQFFGDKAAALREMRRVLAPGGRVALGTPGPTPALFRAVDEALIARVGPEASMFVQTVFSLHDPDEVHRLLEAAGFDDPKVEPTTLTFQVPPPADFFWQYVWSTPLAPVVAGLGPDARAALEQEVVERCRPFEDGDGLTMDTGLLVATARRR